MSRLMSFMGKQVGRSDTHAKKVSMITTENMQPSEKT